MPFRTILAALLCLCAGFAQAQDQCRIEDQCIQDQFLRIHLTDMRIRDSIANISATYTNLQSEPVDLTIYSIYLIAVSAGNERIELSTNRRHIFVDGNATRQEAFSLKFNEPVGGELDLIFVFESPDARYAFLGLTQDAFTGAPELF